MAVFEELLDRSETMTRAALRAIPEGTYRYVDYLDNDGIDLDKPVRIEVAVTVRDGTIEFDLAGTDPQLKGPLNCVPSGSQAAAYFAVRVLTDATIPTNGGCFRPVTLKLPERLARRIRKSPRRSTRAPPRSSASPTCMVSALADVLPDRVRARRPAGRCWSSRSAGVRANGERFIMGELIAGGSGAGARPRRRGRRRHRREQLHEPAGRSAGDGCAAARCTASSCARFRRGRGVSRRPGRHPRIRSARGRHLVHASRRASFLQRPGPRRRGGGASAHSVIMRADGREEVIPSKASDGAPGRPRDRRDAGRRRIRRSVRAARGSMCVRMCKTERSARPRRVLSMARRDSSEQTILRS